MTRYATRWLGATPMSETTVMASSTPALAGMAAAGLGFDRAVNAGGIAGGMSTVSATAAVLVLPSLHLSVAYSRLIIFGRADAHRRAPKIT